VTSGLTDTKPCPRCHEPHEWETCPYVKAIEYDDVGNITRLEFLTPADYGRPHPAPTEAVDNYPKLGARNGTQNPNGDRS
jgi:hypothetical protein